MNILEMLSHEYNNLETIEAFPVNVTGRLKIKKILVNRGGISIQF